MRSARLLIFIYFPVLAFTASISKSGCDSNEPTISLSTRHSVTLSSSNRTYMYFLPSTYSTSTPNPLILSFHGAGRTSDWQADLDRLTDPFFNPDHVLVYPQALQYGATSDFIYWEGAPNATADDVGYVADILDELEQKLCLDTSRIYATGKSQGGGMAARLACNQVVSQRIAAFAPVSGAFYTDDPTCGNPSTEAIPCNPGRDKIPVLDFHGGNDTTISIDGGPRNGGCLPAIQHWVSDWVARDNLTTDTSQTESLTDSLTGSAQMYQYGDGSENGLVTFVYDGDHVNHDWPATIPNSDNEAHGSGPASFNASSMIMAYFQKYDLSGSDNATSPTSTVAGGTATATPSMSTTSTASVAPTSTAASGASREGANIWIGKLAMSVCSLVSGGIIML